ncbi:MAG: SSI family serine proteinase inhibitor [Actinophytocola sp.]|uniref:SSI family serine proteinase inhibitor n=1 Tax=Actinophytocola sp. TaxID=1872138 RepID=UPI003C77AF40
MLAVALPFTVTGVASANTDTSASARTSLTLAVQGPGKVIEIVKLKCDPAGGTHPNAWSACAELRMARGNFNRLANQQEPVACTMEYLPVVAKAIGRWHGKRVAWTHRFSNPCALHAATATVFLF